MMASAFSRAALLPGRRAPKGRGTGAVLLLHPHTAGPPTPSHPDRPERRRPLRPPAGQLSRLPGPGPGPVQARRCIRVRMFKFVAPHASAQAPARSTPRRKGWFRAMGPAGAPAPSPSPGPEAAPPAGSRSGFEPDPSPFSAPERARRGRWEGARPGGAAGADSEANVPSRTPAELVRVPALSRRAGGGGRIRCRPRA